MTAVIYHNAKQAEKVAREMENAGKIKKRHDLVVSLFGSGRRIRTLTYGVRVRCATFTQSRYVLTNKNYYTDFAAFVKSFFHIPRKKAAQGSDRGERAEPCAEREVFYLPCACTRSAPVRYLPSGL